ncbi:MAG TPA: choice-of-anchor P family protein [Terriglobales bacterium]|nr:choice-of-anchor P family protein [Terriglobales bacterium]
MDRLKQRCSLSAALALMLAGLLVWPAVSPANSPTVTGNARGIQATSLGSGGTATTTILSDTGSLAGINDARDASELTTSVPSLLTAETLYSATISWPNEVDSSASVHNLNVTIGGVVVSATSVLTMVSSVQGPNSGITMVDNLAVNGTPISVTGKKNQTVDIPGGQLIINETTNNAGAMTVNGLHVIENGVADVVIASATAGIS